ncbi:hypothetical protein JCM33374_g5928 [Metschnikowia sp. JCM 33374]|nr:hypothetical protein JCM33374_g5928 [Metschnikowia sp. JCM 33374]
MSLSLGNVSTILTQYENEKIQHDIPRLLRTANAHKSSKMYASLHTRLQKLSDSVDEGFYIYEQAHKGYLERYVEEKTPSSESGNETSHETPVNGSDDISNENYASLRKRLLADGAATSLDQDKNATSEQMNNYHETFQEDLLSDLSELASSLKTSARNLSAKIIDDGTLVSETSENMMRSSTLMQSVGTNLNTYLGSKTGGKITIFFMIKTMAFVFVLFFVMVVLTKILPKM